MTWKRYVGFGVIISLFASSLSAARHGNREVTFEWNNIHVNWAKPTSQLKASLKIRSKEKKQTMIEINLEIETKGSQSPLDFLNSLKDFLRVKKRNGEISDYSILLENQGPYVEIEHIVLDTSFPSISKVEGKTCPECKSTNIIEDPDTHEQICKNCGFILKKASDEKLTDIEGS